MLFYSIFIIVYTSIVTILNILFNHQYHDRFWIYIIYAVSFVILSAIIDALVAIIIRKIPEKHFQKTRGLMKTAKWEIKLFDFLQVKKWKDHVPELGGFTNFHKNKVTNPFDNEYISRFILEARYGIMIHYLSVPFSFLIMLGDIAMYTGLSNIWLTIALPIAIGNSFLIILPAFILKNNLPKLERIYEFNLRKNNSK